MVMASTKSLREDVLGDPQVLASIRSVLRRRGVAEHDLDDLCRDVVTEAWAAKNFPEPSADEARKYVHGIAVRIAIDHRRKKSPLGPGAIPYDENENPVATPAAPYEARDASARLFHKGLALFPRTFPWFVQHAISGEEAATIAAREGVTAGHVRHEVSQIRRSLQIAAASLGVVATIVLLFIGARSLRDTLSGRSSEIARPNVPPTTPSQNEARVLRNDAKHDCVYEEWAKCAERLQKAYELDPAGETDEFRELRAKATENAKPPPPPPPPPPLPRMGPKPPL
jgi:DNA-directed RNA polymerase specialized sigma24 family protein